MALRNGRPNGHHTVIARSEATKQSRGGRGALDRFGVLPDEVRYLFKVAAIKGYCRRANVEKVDAGPKGAVISFRDNSFAQPDRLVFFIKQHGKAAKVRPDMKVVFLQDWETPEERLTGTTAILRQLASLAENKKAA